MNALQSKAYHTLPINWARQTLQAESDAELCWALQTRLKCLTFVRRRLVSIFSRQRHLYVDLTLKQASRLGVSAEKCNLARRLLNLTSIWKQCRHRYRRSPRKKTRTFRYISCKFKMKWAEMRSNELKLIKEMQCAKQSKCNTMSCRVLGSLISCCPHLLKAPRTWKVYLSVGEEARR